MGLFVSAPGGKGANEAVQIARLGVHATLVGRIGDDELGQQATNCLEAANRGITGEVDWENTIFKDSSHCTGVAVQVAFDESDGEKQQGRKTKASPQPRPALHLHQT